MLRGSLIRCVSVLIDEATALCVLIDEATALCVLIYEASTLCANLRSEHALR